MRLMFSQAESFTPGQITSMISAAGVALGSAIVDLWKVIGNLYQRLIVLSTEVGELRGKQAGVEELGNEVLRTVADASRPNQPKEKS